jgi:hypothetical protein
MWIFRRAGLCQAGAAAITNTMFWNEIRNHIRERLPAIVDFILFGMALTMIAVVLLGLSWLYVEYGMALFWLGVMLVCAIGLLSGRRAPVYPAEDDSRLWDHKPSLPPPGKRRCRHPAHLRSVGQARLSRRAVRDLSRVDGVG